jgi:peptidyl-prolyl cis-trans isomerase SurA
MITINIKNSRFLNTKTALIVLFTVLAFEVNAQEIIKEKPTDTIKVKLPQSRQKIDGIIATVGEYMVLDSDIDKFQVKGIQLKT